MLKDCVMPKIQGYLKIYEQETNKVLFERHNDIHPENFSFCLGYVGLYETVLYMTGESNSSEKGFKLQLEILKALEDKANKWKEETGLGFSIYATPQEESTDWFHKKLVKRFGIVKGITDHLYVTNFHLTFVSKRSSFPAFVQVYNL